ncbi:MAG: 2-oxo acid dehydrogenase subunit E2 [Defluviitaleaceae bacterium]|nr:2-oxo acid dehydrogenase subunit E2 [Defluviitaleaceae bacterium]
MATGVLMPKAGISVESCIIGTWHKNPGDPVDIGDVLFDYETDKAAFECESAVQGNLIEIFFESGDEVPCLTVVCAIGRPGEDVSALKPIEKTPVKAETDEVGTIRTYNPPQTFFPSAQSGISPRAQRLAKRMKVDVTCLNPTGPKGRIIERDVITAAHSVKAGDNIGGRRQDGFIGGIGGTKYTDIKIPPIRKTIAKAMVKSLTEIAQLTHHHSCDATALLNLRQRYKHSGKGLEGVSINDLVLFAVIKTLPGHPDINAHFINGDTLRRFGGVHLGVAVDTPRGLLVPTIFDADKMSLLRLSSAVKDVAAQAKSGNINPDMLQGASFTVSNLGVLGVEMFTPVINPPQTAILGVCGIYPRVKEADGVIALYQSMGLSLTYDHRAIDGAPASRFVADLVKNIENIDTKVET